MNKNHLNSQINPSNNQIRYSPSYLYGSFMFCAVCLLVAFLVPEDKWICVFAALLGFLYGFLSFYNERVVYDKMGITLFTISGKPFHIDWSDIENIYVTEEPLVSKQLFVGRVLRIKCREKNNTRSTIYRFPYRDYIGIDSFLAFSNQYLSSEIEPLKENDS